MVLQICPNSRGVMNDRNPKLLKMIAVADAATLEDRRRSDTNLPRR